MLFKTDENLPVEAAELLRQAGHDALTLSDQRLNGVVDPIVAEVCRKENRAIVTLDFDFSDIRTYPPSDYFGIVVLRPNQQSKDSVLRLLRQAIQLLSTEELCGRLWIIEETQVRIR